MFLKCFFGLQVRLYSGKCMRLLILNSVKCRRQSHLFTINNTSDMTFLPASHTHRYEFVTGGGVSGEPGCGPRWNRPHEYWWAASCAGIPTAGVGDYPGKLSLTHAHIDQNYGLQRENADLWPLWLTNHSFIFCLRRNWRRLVWSKVTCRTDSCPQPCTMEKARSAENTMQHINHNFQLFNRADSHKTFSYHW